MELVRKPLSKEAPGELGPALDEHRDDAALREHPEGRDHVEATLGRQRDPHALDAEVGERLLRTLAGFGTAYDERRNLPRRLCEPRARDKAEVRVEHDAERAVAGRVTHREVRVVRHCRADPHGDRVGA